MPSLLAFLSATLLLAASTSALPTLPNKNHATAPTQPLNGLPAPAGLTLKYIALGLGTQNYTCPNTTTSPISIGAVATLYDATALLTAAPLTVSTLPALAYSTESSLGLPTLGHHWFSAAGVPTFDLQAADPRAFLSAKKADSVAAPVGSMADSVPWLYLVDDGRGVSVGLKAVYRVETAGGAAEGVCQKVGVVTVRYAAEYWFYD